MTEVFIERYIHLIIRQQSYSIDYYQKHYFSM